MNKLCLFHECKDDLIFKMQSKLTFHRLKEKISIIITTVAEMYLIKFNIDL